MRRTLIILVSTIFLLAIGFGIYFFFTNHARVVVAPTQAQKGLFPIIKKSSSTKGSTSIKDATYIDSRSFPNTQTISTSLNTQKRLKKITIGPVVPGIVVFDATSTATSTSNAIVRYISRKSGDVYSYDVLNGTLSRLSNKTKIGRAHV